MADNKPTGTHRHNVSNNIINETGRAVGTAVGAAAPGVGTAIGKAAEGIGTGIGKATSGGSGYSNIQSGKNVDNNYATTATAPGKSDNYTYGSTTSNYDSSFSGRVGSAIGGVVDKGKNAVYKKVTDTKNSI